MHIVEDQSETTQEQPIEDDQQILDGVSQQYNTMDLIMFQTFFDTLSSDFVPGLLKGLENVKLKPINGTLPLLDHDLVFNFEFNETHLANATIDPTPPLVTIHDGSVTFAVENLNLNVTTNYSYVSDPPIFADIGEGSIKIANLTMSSDASSSIDPFQIDLSNLHAKSEPSPFVDFNGISDFSLVATNVVNTVAAVVRNRLESFIDGGELYNVEDKVEAILNKILGLVDFPISIGDSGFYLDGVFYSDIISGNDQILMPLDVMLRYTNATYDSSVCSFSAMHPIYHASQFDLQMAIQDCAINEVLFTLYEAGVKLPLSLPVINTSKLRLLVGKDIITQFGKD